MNIKKLLLVCAFAFPTTANAVTLVTTSDPGFYNDSLGTVLNLTNGGETWHWRRGLTFVDPQHLDAG